MEPKATAEGGQVGGEDVGAAGLGDRHADQIAALHRVASLPPGEPDERLAQLLAAGCEVLDVARGYVLVRGEAGVRVRVGVGEGAGLQVGDAVVDRRLDDVLHRQATVASLGGPGAPLAAALGGGPVVACPLWVTGRVAGAIAFADPEGHDRHPFTSWQLALVDLVADGAARILEHEADIRALVRLESHAQAMIALVPDPLVRLGPDGQRLGDDGRSDGPFDPTATVRPAGAPTDPVVVAGVARAAGAAHATGELQTAVFAAGPGPDARRVEARFVPGDGDEVLCIVRDVTERHRAELALAEQVAFEALAAAISTRLIGCAPHQLDAAIEAGLGEVATFFGADAASIDELAPDGASLRISHRWDRGAAPVDLGRGRRIDITGFAWLAERFERAGHVVVRGRGAVPREALEQGLAHPDDRGVLWVRLGYGGELVGVLSVQWRSQAPPVSDDVLGLVRFAADAFLGALRRRSVALLADDQAEVFELIARGAPTATALLAARDLVEHHTPGAAVVIATVDDDGRLALVTGPEPDRDGAGWFAALEPGLDNPFSQAVITGEPVLVANAAGDPRFAPPVLPGDRFRSATIWPVRSPRTGQTLAVLGLLGEEAGAPLAPPAVRDSAVALVTVAVERAIDERRLAHQATHDPLTGVGNRAALLDRLTLALARARRSGRDVAVLFCDLDGFKAINDRHGHDRGDRLLVEVARQIERAVRPSDTVCRTGGDEFVVVLEDLGDADQAHVIAERVRASIESAAVEVGETTIVAAVSVGVAIADLAVDDPDRLLRTADLAMYARKQQRALDRATGSSDRPSGEPRGPVPPARTARRGDPFAADLAAAIAADGLHLVHQPLVGRDGVLAGMEALLRWDHPTLGPVGPERIVAAAATEDLAAPLGRWVRRRALADRRRWIGHLAAPLPVPIHLNLSEAELDHPDLADAIVADLADAGLDPPAVVLEVRERHLTEPARRQALVALERVGLEVLVENAGQGGLALGDLAELGASGLKIGPALVDRLGGDDPRGVEVARALVLLAHGLGWRSLAVGVEDDQQRSVLFGFGVDAVQGAVVAMPMAVDQVVTWLSASSRP